MNLTNVFFKELFGVLLLIKPPVEGRASEQQANLESQEMNDRALLIHGKKLKN
jgi:hypothetical protein